MEYAINSIAPNGDAYKIAKGGMFSNPGIPEIIAVNANPVDQAVYNPHATPTPEVHRNLDRLETSGFIVKDVDGNFVLTTLGQTQENLLSKIDQIAEILGILNETHRGRDWLLEQLRKHKISIKTHGNSYDILKECPDDFIYQMIRSLRGEDIEGFEDIKTLTKTFHWFFIDIVAASNPKIPPIEPKKSRTIRLKYDWEEPDKNFLFRIPSDCKQLTYMLSVPKGHDPQIRVLKVDLDTGLKINATPSPTIEKFDDKTVVRWSKNGIKAFDAYQILW